MRLFIALIAAYLIGGIPVGLIIARLKAGVDPRTTGSGTTGATNVSRILGRKWGIIVLLLDAAKGYLPVIYLAPLIAPAQPELAGVLMGVGAMAGHVWTPYAGFRGGKGVATAAGAMGAIEPIALALALGIWFLTVVIFRFVSLASVMAAIVFPAIAWRLHDRLDSIVLGGAIIALVLVYTHRSNFVRIFSGTESKLF